MADRVNRYNYEVMIQSLYNFANRTSTIAEEIHAAAQTCANALGDEDSSISAIYASVGRAQQAYNQVARRALQIAKEMGEELARAEEEIRIWESDD